jgi:GGDEF domain-containing protein
LEGLGLHGSASIGIAVYPEDGVNKEELQRFADAAMYEHKQAKRTGLEPAGERIAS